jgi:hypothetical protein
MHHGLSHQYLVVSLDLILSPTLLNPLNLNILAPPIHTFFDPNSAQQILSTHLTQTPTFDRWIWAPSPRHNFLLNLHMKCSSTPIKPDPLLWTQ